ncbi:MAG TPA: hypothetical protein VHY10_16080 [Xanthobacteraceae bacterium]|jgi:hypothetical protein|nr:hypothetical protein [Xanthobacteraceae bacterium]
MADDNTVQIRFIASTDDALAAITQILAGLTALIAAIRSTNGNLGQLSSAFTSALPVTQINQCAKALGSIGSAAQDARTGMALLHIGMAEQKTLLNSEVSQFKITQDQKFALLEAEAADEYAAELDALDKKRSLWAQGSQQYQAITDQMKKIAANGYAELVRLDGQSIAAQQTLWTSYFSTVTSAFNSQLRGLLEGTTSWHTATIKMLEDLTIKFIEMTEQMVVKWLAAEVAQTTATTTGAAAQAAAAQSSSNAGILANAANAAHTIMVDAGEAFAGVFAFLAPTMGPAAAGPAAAAQASVSAAAIYEGGTDYVVRGGLALIHPGETIIPAARGTGPYTGAATRPQVHAPVSIAVSALDSQSVARFFNDNSHHLMRAINAAVKRGAHLGLRAARP